LQTAASLKIEQIAISQNRLTNFGEIWTADALLHSELCGPEKNQIIKSKMAEGHHFENENCHLPF